MFFEGSPNAKENFWRQKFTRPISFDLYAKFIGTSISKIYL